jgi:hypothetical protein
MLYPVELWVHWTRVNGYGRPRCVDFSVSAVALLRGYRPLFLRFVLFIKVERGCLQGWGAETGLGSDGRCALDA